MYFAQDGPLKVEMAQKKKKVTLNIVVLNSSHINVLTKYY